MDKTVEQTSDLLLNETKAFAFLSTIMKDGSPQVTPVWFNWDGNYIFVNSAKGRIKDRNMRARPQVALAISDPKNPYRFIQIRGSVVEIQEQGAWEQMDELSMKYRGTPYERVAGVTRVIYKILPEHFLIYGN